VVILRLYLVYEIPTIMLFLPKKKAVIINFLLQIMGTVFIQVLPLQLDNGETWYLQQRLTATLGKHI
jgi:hypothetical protein